LSGKPYPHKPICASPELLFANVLSSWDPWCSRGGDWRLAGPLQLRDVLAGTAAMSHERAMIRCAWRCLLQHGSCPTFSPSQICRAVVLPSLWHGYFPRTSRDLMRGTRAVFGYHNTRSPRNHLPPFEATHSNSDIPRRCKQKGNTDEVSRLKTRGEQHIRHIGTGRTERQQRR
jgi:hypothetical protein